MLIQVKVPALGESVKQALLVKWHKNDGDAVKTDEPLCELETDKANVDVPAPAAGIVKRSKKEGEQVNVDEAIAQIDTDGAAGKSTAKTAEKPAEKKPALAAKSEQGSGSSPRPLGTTGAIALEDFSPAVRRLIQENNLDPSAIPPTGPGGRITKEDIEIYLSKNRGNGAAPRAPTAPPAGPEARSSGPVIPRPKDVATVAPSAPAPGAGTNLSFDESGIRREPMSKIRKRIAQTLVQAQQTAAILTTFNEVDLTSVSELRSKFKDRFQEVHGVGLGFMSFFARATVLALREFPRINAFIDGDDVIYHQHVHLGIAVSTDRGLAVPVLRNAEKMSFARIESEIKRLAGAVRDGKLSLEELSGGTFTITNGGVFGSLLSTPIINPPQSGILGMHAIQKRPMVVGDKIEPRSMMYIALSYDHRLVDGRESVSFLVRLKQYLEDPARLMLEI